MNEFIKFLPSIITTLLVVPFGIYIQTRFKGLATRNDFKSAIEQLKRSTKAVESIKSQMNEKYWVKQQVWETKRSAYEELITSLYLTEQYLDKIINYQTEHNDCFVHICHVPSAPYETPAEEEYARSYEEHIEGEQSSFKEKYESEKYINERNRLLDETKESIAKLVNVFSIKSIYLDENLQVIECEISALKHEIFEKSIVQDDHEGITDYFERLLGHYIKCKITLASVITTTKDLAILDLKITN
ncbi:hypothetical protein GCM10007916_14360 [Psychromonas marina]|uniref:DUF4041 domain-containing protein n=1 Tax=Psychromonas marina TaxID=88364 RepID=A0ABQ6DZC9_9GAMM|nr:hypothetical protein [Psychromonas marina]GLS90369.1 hypothetical protein GCM10007916_14360 [Psychromonas marina]